MKMIAMTLAVALVAFGFLVVSPSALMAAEHGGKEHGGGAVKEHGSSTVSGDVAILKEAASALKASRPDLAAKLEAMAKSLS